MSIKSPVTGEHETIKELEIQKDTIKKLYSQINIDISRFFKNAATVELRKCTATGYRFYYPFTIFGDDRFYEELQAKFAGYYVEDRWEHRLAIKYIPIGSKVLEVGSGAGYFLSLLKKNNIDAIGLELNQKAVHAANEKGLQVHNELLDQHAAKHKELYDTICSFQVLEHIYDVKPFIEESISVLKPGGKIIIGVPNNNPFIFKHDVLHTLNLPPHHAGLWNRESFENLQRYFPLELTAVHIEPLQEIKEWYHVQKKYISEKNKIAGLIMNLIPRQVYKLLLRMFNNHIEGRNIVAVFTKK